MLRATVAKPAGAARADPTRSPARPNSPLVVVRVYYQPLSSRENLPLLLPVSATTADLQFWCLLLTFVKRLGYFAIFFQTVKSALCVCLAMYENQQMYEQFKRERLL